MYEYRTDFYRFLASFAVRSAQRIVPKLTAAVPVRNVVDFGCGQGAWLSVWAAAGSTVIGVDGLYIDRRGLLINTGAFVRQLPSGVVDRISCTKGALAARRAGL